MVNSSWVRGVVILYLARVKSAYFDPVLHVTRFPVFSHPLCSSQIWRE